MYIIYICLQVHQRQYLKVLAETVQTNALAEMAKPLTQTSVKASDNIDCYLQMVCLTQMISIGSDSPEELETHKCLIEEPEKRSALSDICNSYLNLINRTKYVF